MPTTRVAAYRCGTDWSGWLDDTHPTVEEGEVHKKVCFSNRPTGYKYSAVISVKNYGSFIVCKHHPRPCFSRYCGTD